ILPGRSVGAASAPESPVVSDVPFLSRPDRVMVASPASDLRADPPVRGTVEPAASAPRDGPSLRDDPPPAPAGSGRGKGDVNSRPQPMMKYCITMLKMVEVSQYRASPAG